MSHAPKNKLVTWSFCNPCLKKQQKKPFTLPFWNSEKLLPTLSISKDNWRFCFPLRLEHVAYPKMISLLKLSECLFQCHFLFSSETTLGTQKRRELISLEHWSWTLLYFWGKWSSSSDEKRVFVKKITDLFKVIQLVSDRAWIETWVCLIPRLTVFILPHARWPSIDPASDIDLQNK